MKREITFTLNGEARRVTVRSHHSFMDVLHNDLRMTGPREVCGVGVCGACTVLMNDRPVAACVLLAPFADGADIKTVEGLAQDDKLHPLQEAFIQEGAFQCGYCTPGMLMVAKALLDENPDPTEAEIKKFMEGSLCRCTSYYEILRAVRRAAERVRG
ncbi:MAG: (2Fe-2S)-binding protein [Candidatus Tectomicrobia bacterium]|nr:(2Fe-2S)-binding protein [Candidatus Tectomicrobia bacterium]